MRVSQIQNLTWAGNVVVLAGLVWVGLQFLQVQRLKKPATEPEWPRAKTVESGVRWPGELATFDSIWKTPIGGKNPPPPAPPAPPPKLDRWTEFQGKLKYMGGWEYIDAPWYSTARLTYEGKDLSVTPGGMVGTSGFQLLAFTIDESKTDPNGHPLRTALLVFRHPDTGASMTLPQPIPTGSLFGAGGESFVKRHGPPVEPGRVSKTDLKEQAFLDPVTGAWNIPDDEVLWIEDYGAEVIWPKLSLKPEVDAEGVSHGLRVKSQPEQGTPLASTHGVAVDDIIRSINGEPMRSKEDIANYLRGPGKGLTRYSVVIDTAGKERTVVFRVQRPRR